MVTIVIEKKLWIRLLLFHLQIVIVLLINAVLPIALKNQNFHKYPLATSNQNVVQRLQ